MWALAEVDGALGGELRGRRRTRLDDRWLVSATILTTTANAICRPVHDRMPCVLADREAEAAWLAADVDASAALELLEPVADPRCSAAPANPVVGRAGVEGPRSASLKGI